MESKSKEVIDFYVGQKLVVSKKNYPYYVELFRKYGFRHKGIEIDRNSIAIWILDQNYKEEQKKEEEQKSESEIIIGKERKMENFTMCDICPNKEQFAIDSKEIQAARRSFNREKRDYLKEIEEIKSDIKKEKEEIENSQKMLEKLFLVIKTEIENLQIEENTFFSRLSEFETAEYRDKSKFEKINEQIKENRKFLISQNFKIIHNCEEETKEITLAEYLEGKNSNV